MKKEFLIQRSGRDFVLFAGLLDAAHDKGLSAIKTELLQAPSDANGQTTIVRAEVLFDDGKRFSGIGDATPQNVGRNIVPHAIRMAETRAKARALRDALNIGGAALEELGDLDDDEPAPVRQPARQQPTPIDRARQMARDDATPEHGSPAPSAGRNPALATEWATAQKAQKALRDIGVTPPMLPPDDASKAELDSFAADCRSIYAAKKPQQGATA